VEIARTEAVRVCEMMVAVGDGRDMTPESDVDEGWKRSRVARAKDMLEADQNRRAFVYRT
jgi:hypothetical protein